MLVGAVAVSPLPLSDVTILDWTIQRQGYRKTCWARKPELMYISWTYSDARARLSSHLRVIQDDVL
jgi:hypothetical protein